MKKVFFAAAALFVISASLTSCMKTCYNQNGSSYEAMNCNGTNGGQNNGQNTPTNPNAGTMTALVMPDAASLSKVGIAGQGQFYEVTRDYDQNYVPDAAQTGIDAGQVYRNQVSVSGLLSYDNGVNATYCVITMDAGTAVSLYNQYMSTQHMSPVGSAVSNIPWAYAVNPSQVTPSTDLRGKSNCGIFIKPLTGKKEFSADDWKPSEKTLAMMSDTAQQARVDALEKMLKVKRGKTVSKPPL